MFTRIGTPQRDGVYYLGPCVCPGREQYLREGEFNLHLYPLGGPPWYVMRETNILKALIPEGICPNSNTMQRRG